MQWLRQPVALVFFETPKRRFPFQMLTSFFTIAEPTTEIYKEKGSKFIAFAHPVTDSEQIKTILNQLKKEYFDASHHCYGWVLGADKTLFRAFDDGEPNHSAGDPILGQIRSKNLTNVLVVVVRYFGGTKLGVSGLIMAYKAAAGQVLTQAKVIEKTITKQFILEFAYPETSVLMALLKAHKGIAIDRSYHETCQIRFDLPISEIEGFTNALKTHQALGHSVLLKQLL